MSSTREDTKRQEILDRSIALFFERGISGLSMEAIASGIGVSKTTLYKYFPTKEQLGGATIERRIATMIDRLDAIDRMPGISYPQRFQAFFVAVDETIRPAIPVFLPDIVKESPLLWKKIQGIRAEKVFPRLAQLVKEGRELGYVRDDLDAFVAGSLVIAIAEQIGRPEFILGLPIPPSQALQTVIRVMLGGILSEEGRKLFASVHFGEGKAEEEA